MFLMLFLSSFVFFSAADPPQRCNKLFVSRFEGSSNENITVSANLELIANANLTTIYVTNVSIDDNYNYGPPLSVCYDVDGGYAVPPTNSCSTSLDGAFSFSIQEPSFSLQIYFPKIVFIFDFFFGFGDDGTFSYKDGTFFTPNNSSFVENAYYMGVKNIYNQTCTSFADAPIAPANANKCKTFNSQILILNSTDNYSIYASSYMTWDLSENQLVTTGNYSIPGKYYFGYILNDGDEECEGTDCTFNLKPGDKKLIISAAIDKPVGFDFISYPIPMLGRIIFHGEEILMHERIPFSPTNDCLYFNFPYSDSQVSTNKFCCIAFENK